MESLGFHSELEFGDRKLLVESSYVAERERLVCNVFDDGRLLEKREQEVPPDLPLDEVRARLEELHRQVAADYEILHYIQRKIRTVHHPPSNNRLGLVFLHKGLYREAAREFTLALKGDATQPEYYRNLARALLAMGRTKEALATLEEGLQHGPDFADLHNLRGLILLRLGKFAGAVQSFQRALELNPDYAEAHLNLALALVTSAQTNVDDPALPPVLTRIRRALASVRKAVESCTEISTDEAEAVFEAAKLQDLQAMRTQLERLRSKLPAEDRFVFDHEFYLQFMYGGKGQDEEALETYVQWLQEQLRKYPDYADLHNNLGIAYLIQARNLFIKAMEQFREALRINPGFERAARNLRLAQNDGRGFLILLRAVLK